jgi:hypothetical protein
VVRGLVAAALLLALALGWERVRPRPWAGDVPYVPTRPLVVDAMLDLAGAGADDRVLDLGSGDGRIVIRAAERFGARGRGLEIDPRLVTESRRRAAAAGVGHLVDFVEGDLFEAALDGASVVTLYLLPTVNLALRPRLLAELEPGTRVVSQTFDMAEWQPDDWRRVAVEPPADLYLWVIPAAAGGVWQLEAEEPKGLAEVGGPASLRLMQSFQRLDGELVPASGAPVPVTGTVAGRDVVVETARGPRGDGVNLRFEGRLAGDRLQGRAMWVADGARPADFSAIRRAGDLAGTWEVTGGGETDPPATGGRAPIPAAPEAAGTPAPVGSPAPWMLRIEDTGVVRRSWRRRAEDGEFRPLADFYAWGTSVYFVTGSDGGQGGRLYFRGLLEGDRISGTVQEGGRLIPWTARRVGTRPR